MPSENGSSLRPEQKLDCQSVEGLTMDLFERQRYLDFSSAGSKLTYHLWASLARGLTSLVP